MTSKAKISDTSLVTSEQNYAEKVVVKKTPAPRKSRAKKAVVSEPEAPKLLSDHHGEISLLGSARHRKALRRQVGPLSKQQKLDNWYVADRRKRSITSHRAHKAANRRILWTVPVPGKTGVTMSLHATKGYRWGGEARV